MQATGVLIIAIREFGTGMQSGHDDFGTGAFQFRVRVYWHAATIIFDFQ